MSYYNQPPAPYSSRHPQYNNYQSHQQPPPNTSYMQPNNNYNNYNRPNISTPSDPYKQQNTINYHATILPGYALELYPLLMSTKHTICMEHVTTS